MEAKEMKIVSPDGYEIDRENSTVGCIKFKPKSALTYKDVAKGLFSKGGYFIGDDGSIGTLLTITPYQAAEPNNATSQKQLEKLLALNQLMNVAKYLNGDWKPDWYDEECKYNIYISNGDICIDLKRYCCENSVYFKTAELAQQAIDILGEDTIRLALSTDW